MFTVFVYLGIVCVFVVIYAPVFPFYLLLVPACSFLLVCAFAFLFCRLSASLLCSSVYLLFRFCFCLLPVFASRFLLVLAFVLLLSAFCFAGFLLRSYAHPLSCLSPDPPSILC